MFPGSFIEEVEEPMTTEEIVKNSLIYTFVGIAFIIACSCGIYCCYKSRDNQPVAAGLIKV